MTVPVRWKLAIAALLLLQMMIAIGKAAKIQSMDDGWTPIIGTQREGLYDEITHYRNPASKKADPVKAEKLTLSTSKVESTKKLGTSNAVQSVAGSVNPAVSSGSTSVSKMSPHSKPVYLMPSIGMHASQLGPMNTMLHHRPMKYSHLMKVHHHAKPPLRTKPLRHQIPSYSQRDEVFIPAPSSNVGPYTFYSAAQPPVKARPSQHIEFANHFPIPNSEDEIYQLVRAPVHQYVIPKAPISNDVHYSFQNPDEFNRNVNQSPYKFESAKEKVKKVKELPRQEPLIQKVHPFHLTTAQPSKSVEVHITKEKLKVFHNAIPSNYNPLEDYDYRPVKTTPAQKRPATYEVTEGKWNQETPSFQFHYTTPPKSRIPTRVFTEESKPFLPTPVKPESVPPTLPTESEISTIYNQVKFNRQNTQPGRHEFSTPTPISFFDVKEVSTHFPILGPPEFQSIAHSPPRYQFNDEKENEITTKLIIHNPTEHHYQQPDVLETTTNYIPTVRPQRNRRPNRRRRPTSTTTEVEEVAEIEAATQIYEAQKTDSSAEVTTPRTRIPLRYRTRSTTTTLQPEVEVPTVRQRQRRPRPTTTTESVEVEVPDNHKAEYESLEEKFTRLTTTTEKEFPANFESHFTAPYKIDPSTEIIDTSTEEIPYRLNRFYTNPPNRDEKPVEEEEEEEPASVEIVSGEKDEDQLIEDYRVQYHESQKQPEALNSEITINTPENELDFTTRHTYYTTKAPQPETTTELFTTTPTTTTTTTTTTTEAPKRVRGRPVKYDHSNRPRFSVKEYKQRLITTTTSTEAPKVQSDVMRIRFPNRSRRPITPSPTTTPAPVDVENEGLKTKFHPKDPRHPNLENATEKLKFNTVNTRIRPFGRFKSTTEATTTTLRVSIKPNIFGNLRRPTPISLKTRILNRQRTNSTTVKPDITTLDNALEDNNETDQTEIVETTIPYSVEESEVSSEFGAKKTEVEATTIMTTLAVAQEEKQDDYRQSQIVSDLTSSAKNEYNKPGLFKNVQPNSRKVPSYFTLATDDPILPIEAFFPNLKDKQ